MFLLKCHNQTNFWYLVDNISEYDFILAHIEVSSRSNQIFQCYCRLFKIQSNVWENQFLWFVYLNSEGFYMFVVQSFRALIPLYICCCVERLDCILDYISSFMDQSGSFSFVFGFRTLALAWMRGMRGECPSLPERMLIGSCLYQK